MNGRDYWRSRLAPLARDGFRRGVLDEVEVVLYADTGAEVHLARPSARQRWIDAWAADLLAATDNGHDLTEYEDAAGGLRMLLSVGTGATTDERGTVMIGPEQEGVVGFLRARSLSRPTGANRHSGPR